MMKTRTALLTLLAFVPVAIAADAPTRTAPVLALAPADALGVVYLAQPAALFDHPFWTATGATDDPVAAELLRATAAAFNGPTMLAVCGSPLNPAAIRVELATQPAQGADAFFTQLKDAWMPAAAKAAMDPTAKVEASGGMQSIRLPGPMPIVVFAAEKNGLVYGSSRQTDVAAWLADREMPERLIAGDDVKKLPADALATAEAFAYLNTRGLMTLAAVEMEQAVPGLFAALGLERLEFAALTAEWTGRNVAAELTLGIAVGEGGVWDVLAAHNAPSEITALLPADYTFYLREAWTNSAERIDQINAVLAAIDPDIVAEFRQECAEFRAEYGFDPLADFMANLVDEWVLGARVDAGGNVGGVAVFRLADPTVFQSHVQALIKGFDLEVESTAHGATLIHTTPPASGTHLAWATVGHYLVLSNRAEPVAEIIAAQANPVVAPAAADGVQVAKGKREAAGAMSGVLRQLPAETAHLLFVNLASLARVALELEGHDPQIAELSGQLATLADANAGLGIALTRAEGALSLRAVVSEEVSGDVRAAVWKTMGTSLQRSRELAQRAASAAKIREIMQYCMIYANDHKGAWPQTLVELVQAGELPIGLLRASHDASTEAITADNVQRTSSYLYRDGTGVPPEEVVVCERELRDGGANFGFADGHVAWISGPQAQELLAQMQRSAAR